MDENFSKNIMIVTGGSTKPVTFKVRRVIEKSNK